MANNIIYANPANIQELMDALKTRVVRPVAGKGLSTNDLTNELKAKYDQAAQKVDSLESAGAEANVIETVKVNGSPLTPDGSKAVNITVPTKVSQITKPRPSIPRSPRSTSPAARWPSPPCRASRPACWARYTT